MPRLRQRQDVEVITRQHIRKDSRLPADGTRVESAQPEKMRIGPARPLGRRNDITGRLHGTIVVPTGRSDQSDEAFTRSDHRTD